MVSDSLQLLMQHRVGNGGSDCNSWSNTKAMRLLNCKSHQLDNFLMKVECTFADSWFVPINLSRRMKHLQLRWVLIGNEIVHIDGISITSLGSDCLNKTVK